ncbi:TonB-dependent receptor [Luminiphilus sp.]|nr:TonB-dependent receptor [Luminiphilus sp.]
MPPVFAPKTVFLAALAAFLMAASHGNVAAELEEITIIGTQESVRDIAGTGAIIGSAQIRDELATDVNQLLKTIPGTYIREEDGYGLRPNIGIRGATSERSAKITLMEDGVLIAPAPYAAPAAYYFPTLSRMHAVEVLKGASQLRYGPQTTGGVINLVSTPIPETASGRLQLVYGQDNQTDILANYGGQIGSFGFSLETAQRSGDGFKTIDRSNRNAGYKIADYVAKLSWQGTDHALRLKAQYSEEESDETYLGLTDIDFAQSADRRYGLSTPDQMANDHKGISVAWEWQLATDVALTTTAYRNEFHRDWFKLSGGGKLVSAANQGDADAQAVLDGEQDSLGLSYKHNNRRYVSEGLQTNVAWDIGSHSMSLGARYHQDEVDRLQPTEKYDQINGDLLYRGTTTPSSSNNRIQEADALALWITDAWMINDALRLDLALRHERIDTSEVRYADLGRTNIASHRDNDVSIWLPGVAALYQIDDQWSLLAGIHRGFSPLGGSAKSTEKPETSVNYEMGVRYDGAWFAEVVGFYSDFSNKAESCSNSQPCSNGAVGGTFVTGEAVIAGVEVQLGHIFQTGDIAWPISLAYTYSHAEASRDNVRSGVLDGDELASVPSNTLSMRMGAEVGARWDSYAVVKYTDSMCVKVSCNREVSPFGETEGFVVIDLASRYAFSESLSAFVKLENALDERAIVSRQPDGARPNKPRTAMIGVEWMF